MRAGSIFWSAPTISSIWRRKAATKTPCRGPWPGSAGTMNTKSRRQRPAAVVNRLQKKRSTSMITISAFRWVPTFARGLVRDLRVRWALEEAGLPYEAWLIGPDDQKSESYRAMQPFGQVPAFEERRSGAFRKWGDPLAHCRSLGGSDAVGLESACPRNGMDVRSAEFCRTAHSEPDGDRPVSCGGGLGQAAPAGGPQIGADASDGAIRLARWSRVPGGSLHRRRSSDDDRVKNPAPYRSDRTDAHARDIPATL